MTDRKISAALKKIGFCKEHGFHMEALMRLYLLNVSMIKFILSVLTPELDLKDEKIKTILKIFIRELSLHPEMKSVIQKKSLKSLQSWLEKTDSYFKSIKMGVSLPTSSLYSETEQVCALLKISVSKVLLRHPA
jgi:hypothetical protein